MSEKSEGVNSLHVDLLEDYIDFNYTRAGENLSEQGYSNIVIGKRNEFEWSIKVIWEITDKEYTKHYASNITIYFCSIDTNDTDIVSYGSAAFDHPTMVNDGDKKKEKEKELLKQAIYEIASIIGITLDWNRHFYKIDWMTMTSEGSYEEE